MQKDKIGTVNAIMADAKVAAEGAKDANYIRVSPKDDRSAVVLTVNVNGKDGSWITYNGSQLDELIRQLRMFRADLKR